MLNTEDLIRKFDPERGTIADAAAVTRRLADVRGSFNDNAAYDAALARGNPVLYTVAAVECGNGSGDLHYGLGLIMPGKVGNEYYLTKGHYHSWREAAELYIGLTGQGCMLLEDEATGESRMVPLGPNTAVYVPGRTAHRTINTGNVPLTYVGIYPAKAGHDYVAIAQRNFRCVVIEQNGEPVMLERPTLSQSR